MVKENTMSTTTTLDTLKINYLTQAQYDEALENSEINENEIYLTPQSGGGGISSESDPIFSASAAAGITSSDITNWNGKTSNTGTVTGMTTTAGTHTAGAQTVSSGVITTNIPTKTSHLTNDSGFITSYTDENMKWTASTTTNTYYPLQSTSTATTSTANTINGVSFYQYYNTAGGYRRLDLGNTTAYKSTGGAYGTIRLYGAAATYYGDLVPGVLGTTSGDGHISANRTWTLPDKTGTVALTSDIPTVPTKVSDLTNDSGFLTSADIPEGASAYTGTISAVGTSASSGSSNGFARGDHVHNITKTTIDTQLGTGSGTTKFYREDGTWATPAYTTNTDENVKSTAVTAATTNYIVGSTTSTTTTGGLSKHASAVLYTTADSGTSGYTQLRLGNTTATSSAGGKEGQIRLYGTSATYYLDLKPGAITSSSKTITFPNATGTVALTSDIPSVPTSAANATTGVTISDHGTTSVGSASNWSAGSGSYSATVTSHVLSFSHTHTAPSLTVTSTTVVNGKSHTVNDTGHTHTLS